MPSYNQKLLTGTLLLTGASAQDLARHALELAKDLLGLHHAEKIEKGTHPDLHLYYPEGKSGTHNIASMRSLIDEMQLPPFEAPRKIFIIHDAERMMAPSSNALLKTFEEPDEDALLMLLSTQPQNLLPTIVSRCRCIRLAPSSDVSEFNPTLLQLLTENKDHPSLLKMLDALEDSLSENEEESVSPDQVDKIFHQLLNWFRDRTLLASSGPQELLFYKELHPQLMQAQALPLPSLERVLELITQARLGFQRNIRLRTCLEHFFLNL